MPTLEEVQAIRKKAFDESYILVAKKGRDYNREKQLTGDTLFNLRVAHLLGIVDSPMRSVLVRLSDKFQRLISLSTSPDVAENESIWDTILDIHNYTDYVYALWLEYRENLGDATKKAQEVEP